jgi:hypothetical protein
MSPASIALARAGDRMIASGIVETEVQTKIINEATELGEPWNLVPAVTNTIVGQLSAAQSVTTATDVHYVYPNGAGTLGYMRQDGTNLSLGANGLDVTPIGSGTFPVIARPDRAAGCYSIGYASGNSIMRRRFTGSVGTLAPATTLFTTGSAPTRLSVQLESGGPPAMVWQEGTSIYFGLPADNPPPTLAATPSTTPADGVTQVAIAGGVLRDTCGTPVAAGTLVTVATTAGSIVESDADGSIEGTQLAAAAGGTVSFTVLAPSAAAVALVSARLTTDGPVATTSVTFTDPATSSDCTGLVVGTPCVTPADLCVAGACDGAGTCVAAEPRDCDDLVTCTIDSCDPQVGCLNTPVDCGPHWDELGVRGGGCGCSVRGGRDLAGTLLVQLVIVNLMTRRRRRRAGTAR